MARVAILTLLAAAGCGGDGEGEAGIQTSPGTVPPLSEEAQAMVDRGNTALRAGQYAEGLDFFSKALEIHPDHPVPQFGSLMAAMAVGDTALVASLREKLQTTGPELLEMLGPEGGMGTSNPGMPGTDHMPQGGMPPGHPSFETLPPDTSGDNPVVRG